MSAVAANKLAADLAFKANVDAVSRDYITEPHLGERERCEGMTQRDRQGGGTACACASWQQEHKDAGA